MRWPFFLLLGVSAELALTAQEAGENAAPVVEPYLNKAEQARLATDKVLVSSQEVRQCFAAYMDSSLPSFVTSDALLNAYQVLFEETLRLQEGMQARYLRTLCQDLWRLLATVERMYRGDAAQIAAAKQRVRFVIGVALRLQGDELGACEASLKKAIETEVAAIEKAEGTGLAPWHGSSQRESSILVYTTFRPTGFYTTSERLERYFRARHWLQIVPFRLKHPEELLAYHMLEMVQTNPVGYGGRRDASLLPVGSDLATNDRLYHACSRLSLLPSRLGLADYESGLSANGISRQDEPPVLVDADFFRRHVEAVEESLAAGQDAGADRVQKTTPEPAYHVLSTFRLPEDAAFTFLERQGDASKAERSPGIAFMGWLGIPQAESLLEKQVGSKAMERLPALRPHPEDYGRAELMALPWWRRIYSGHLDVSLQYRAALRVLAEVDKRAPPFMQGEAWRTKTLQTVASGWAQTRHAWTLQGEYEFHVPWGTSGEKGFVEPVPEFFSHLAGVAGQMGGIAAEAEANSDPVAPMADSLKEISRMLRDTASKNATREEIASDVLWANENLAKFHGYGSGMDTDKATAADLKKLAAELDDLSVELERDARPGTPLWEKVQKERRRLDQLWHALEVLCLQLSILAEKQLQQVPLNEDDGRLIEHICYDLSAFMFYSGAALKHPVDNALRIARMATDPYSKTSLYVGTGRPRLMYVLYPWQGKEVLCRGVVMPYHEVRDKQALTDEEWQKRQQGDSRAAVPEWLRSLVPVQNVQLTGRE